MPRTLTEEDIATFREQLCVAACRLFAQRGTDGVTMRALAEMMGISPMKPYHYFRDKEEILAASMTRALNRFVSALELSEHVEGGVRERAAAKRRAYVRYALAEPDCYRVIFELPHPDLNKFPELQEALSRARTVMRSILSELVEGGVVEGDPVVLSHVFWCTVHGAVSLYLAGKLDTPEQLDAILDVAMKGLLAGLAPSAA